MGVGKITTFRALSLFKKNSFYKESVYVYKTWLTHKRRIESTTIILLNILHSFWPTLSYLWKVTLVTWHSSCIMYKILPYS